MPQFGAYQMAREGKGGLQILNHYYRGSTVSYRKTVTAVNVQVFGPDPYNFRQYGDSASTTEITVAGGSWRLRADGRTLTTGRPGTLTVSTRGNDVIVRVGGRSYRAGSMQLQWSGTRFYRTAGKAAVASVEGAHGTYRHGRLRLAARDGTPNVVNNLRLNTEYLYGVAEMPSSWGTTSGKKALRAQAIVARSYAQVKSSEYKKACGCHLVDDVRDQMFTGWNKESEGSNGAYGAVWKDAVDRTQTSVTEGRLLMYGGSPVIAHYYSASGGRTANSEDVWSSRVGYERSVPDDYSLQAPGNSHRRWGRLLTQQQAQRLFDLPDVVSIRVASRYSSGQARTLVAKSSAGRTSTLTGKADQVRAMLGARTRAGNVPSAWIRWIRAN